jgi:hypothetical protein
MAWLLSMGRVMYDIGSMVLLCAAYEVGRYGWQGTCYGWQGTCYGWQGTCYYGFKSMMVEQLVKV